jgi:hypothetical protein
VEVGAAPETRRSRQKSAGSQACGCCQESSAEDCGGAQREETRRKGSSNREAIEGLQEGHALKSYPFDKLNLASCADSFR